MGWTSQRIRFTRNGIRSSLHHGWTWKRRILRHLLVHLASEFKMPAPAEVPLLDVFPVYVMVAISRRPGGFYTNYLLRSHSQVRLVWILPECVLMDTL